MKGLRETVFFFFSLQTDMGSKCKKFKLPEKTELRRNFYSVPDLVQITINNRADDTASLRNHKSQDNINGADNSLGDESSSTSSQLSNTSNAKAKPKTNIHGNCVNGVTKAGTCVISNITRKNIRMPCVTSTVEIFEMFVLDSFLTSLFTSQLEGIEKRGLL